MCSRRVRNLRRCLLGVALGFAVGTVLLPEMARRIAAGDAEGARSAQQRAQIPRIGHAVDHIVGNHLGRERREHDAVAEMDRGVSPLVPIAGE